MSVRDVTLASAFPRLLRDDVLRAASVPSAPLVKTDQLSPLQQEILDCMLTRRWSGFVGEENLTRIVTCRDVWVPPFLARDYTDAQGQAVNQRARKSVRKCLAPQSGLGPTTLRLVNSREEEDGSNG